MILFKNFEIHIVYQNELGMECSLLVELGFYVAKQEDGRRDRHIHIVYRISLLEESKLSGGICDSCL